MGENQISEPPDPAHMRGFVRTLLEDVHALERLIEQGRIESGVRRIGAEQEMFLLDRDFFPKCAAVQILERLEGQPFTTELAQFNLEANLSPLAFEADCLSRLEAELEGLLDQARAAAEKEGARVLLCGILPTLDRTHLGLDSMTPIPRYLQLNRTMVELRGGHFKTVIKGIDEFQMSHDNVMLEACNTSFQLHYQVGAEEFARLYNLAQLATAPALAAAVNSPVLLRHRLWHETRVALFQQSIDTRSEAKAARGTRPRVSFGERWVARSALEIFREDVARFRSLIAAPREESPVEVVERGGVPQLKALRLHNGTIYRWNRPCYGVTGGVPHLRIEMRALPAGPSLVDEVANAAFLFGLMAALPEEYGDVTEALPFDDAKANFVAAARYGLHARFRWLRGRSQAADELILAHLLPLARAGLDSRGIRAADSDRYLGVLEERVKSGRTGAQWALDSLAAMESEGETGGRTHERYRALTTAMLQNQETGLPVARWPLADLAAVQGDPDSYRKVEQVMTTDVFTVHPEDIADLAASLMEWEHIRYVPVEDQEGRLVGLVSHRSLLRMLSRGRSSERDGSAAVRDIMVKEPITIGPEVSTLEAIETMRRNQIGCLPVVKDGRLVGIVTEHDFAQIAASLLDRWLRSE